MKYISSAIGVLLLLIFILQISCPFMFYGTTVYVPHFRLIRPSDAKLLIPFDIIEYTLKDKDVAVGTIRIAPLLTGFWFEILNDTKDTVKIIWEKCTIIDSDNKSYNAQFSTNDEQFIKGLNDNYKIESKVHGFIVPIGYIAPNYKCDKDYKKLHLKEIGLILAIDINNNIKTYDFIFRVCIQEEMRPNI